VTEDRGLLLYENQEGFVSGVGSASGFAGDWGVVVQFSAAG